MLRFLTIFADLRIASSVCAVTGAIAPMPITGGKDGIRRVARGVSWWRIEIMPIVHSGSGPFPELARIAAKHRRLAEDLDRIAQGRHPAPDDLRTAPLLMEWQVHTVPVPHLVGIVLGHPLIEDGHTCRTSQLFTIDPQEGYARTWSRFYRLLDRISSEGV